MSQGAKLFLCHRERCIRDWGAYLKTSRCSGTSAGDSNLRTHRKLPSSSSTGLMLSKASIPKKSWTRKRPEFSRHPVSDAGVLELVTVTTGAHDYRRII